MKNKKPLGEGEVNWAHVQHPGQCNATCDKPAHTPKKWGYCCESQPTIDPETGKCQNGCGAKTQHTPTPWEVDREAGDDSHVMIDSQSDVYIGEIFIEANAAFIVRAVNAHEELLHVIKGMVHHLEGGAPGLREHFIQVGKEAVAKAGGR
jgi:hypothetical protein